MNKILLTGIISVLFLVYFSYSSNVFAAEDTCLETKGKKGIKGRGKWLAAIGMSIPILFKLLYF